MQATKQIDAAAHIILIKARKTFSSEQYLIACLYLCFNNILKKVKKDFFTKIKMFLMFLNFLYTDLKNKF
jgi:hypothetical protein